MPRLVVLASIGLFRLLRKKLTTPLKPFSSSPPAPNAVPAFNRRLSKSPTSIPYFSLISALLVSRYSIVSLTPTEISNKLREKKSSLLRSSSFIVRFPAVSIATTGFILINSRIVGGGREQDRPS